MYPCNLSYINFNFRIPKSFRKLRIEEKNFKEKTRSSRNQKRRLNEYPRLHSNDKNRHKYRVSTKKFHSHKSRNDEYKIHDLFVNDNMYSDHGEISLQRKPFKVKKMKISFEQFSLSRLFSCLTSE